MKNKTDLSKLLQSIEEGKIELTNKQKKQIREVIHRPIYNDNWDKLKQEFKTEFEKFNYTRNNKTIICSLSLQEAVSILLRIKYKAKNVREIQEPYNNIKNFTIKILNILSKDKT